MSFEPGNFSMKTDSRAGSIRTASFWSRAALFFFLILPGVLSLSACSSVGSSLARFVGWENVHPEDTHTHSFRTRAFGTSALLDEASRFYFKGDFIEARGEYKRFLELHPTHPLAAFAQYRMGMCDYYQILSPDRDPTNLRKSLSDFQKVIDEYPQSQYVEKAEKKVAECRNTLSEVHFYVGNFYYRTKRYKASANRFQVILLKYPDSQIYDKAQFYFALSKFHLKDRKRAAHLLDQLIQQFPKSKYAGRSRTLLAYWKRQGYL